MKTLKKYTVSEKIKVGRWAQKDGEVWKEHYIKYGTEYFGRVLGFTKKEALQNWMDAEEQA